MEAGETPEQTIRREISEELQHEVSELEYYGQILDDYHNLIHVFVSLTGTKPLDKFVLTEGQDIRFFNPDELPSETVPYVRDILAYHTSVILREEGG